MSRAKATRIDQTEAKRQRRLATIGVVLGVFIVLLLGAWLEGRWPHAAGAYITVTPPSSLPAADILWELRRIDGVRDAVAVTRGSLLASDIKGSGWEVAWYFANQTDTSALAFLAPDPLLRLQQGRLPETQSTDEAVLGYELAQRLGLRAGSTILVHERPFRVAGIWQPSGRVPGNFVQFSAAAADGLALADSGGLAHVLVLPQAGRDADAVAREIWRKLPQVNVLAPVWELARVQQEHTTLLLAAGGTVLLALLLCLLLLGSWQAAQGESKLGLALVSAAGGWVAAYGVAFLINAYAARALGLTPLNLSLRVSLSVIAAAAAIGWLFERFRGSVPPTLRYVATIAVLALCTLGIGTLGALNESLSLALDEAQRTAADWVTLTNVEASSVLLRDLQRLPGIRGYTIEAYAGWVNEDEARWDGPWPASGLLYGLESVGGEGALTVPYRLRFWSGGPPDPASTTQAVLGYDLARARGLAVGDTVVVRGAPFAVVGIREPLRRDPQSDVNYRVDVTLEGLRRVLHDPLASGHITLLIPPASSQEDKGVYLQEASVRLNVGRIMTVEDRLAEIALAFPGTHTLTPADAEGVVRHARTVYAGTWLLCSAVLLVIAALASGAAMAQTVLHDEERVALLRALGSSEGMLFGDYLQQAAIVGVAGALLGGLGSWVLCAVLNGIGPAKAMELLFSARLGAAVSFGVAIAAMAGAVAPVARAVRRSAARTLYGSSRPSEGATTGPRDGSLPMTGILTQGGSEA